MVLISKGFELPFSDDLLSEISLGNWANEMRDGDIESVASVMLMDIIECIFVLCV